MRNIHRFGCLLFSMALAPSAFAQDARKDGPASTNASGDIVVTATRQETTLSKTPLAVSAIGGDDLIQSGISDARDLMKVVPNFALTQDSYDARIAIRGVTSTDSTEKGDASVAFLLNGIYIARPADAMMGFYDLERVEVLRGPQGTLYGRNTTAGVVNVITARPKNSFEAKFDGKTGSLGTLGGMAAINIPVGATLGLRAAVNYDERNTYVLEGPRTNIDLNPGLRNIAGRLSFGGALGDNFDFVVVGDVSHATGNDLNVVDTGQVFQMPTVPGTDPINRGLGTKRLRTLEYAPTFSTLQDDVRYGVMTEMTYHLGDFDLTYLGGYRRTTRDDDRNTRIYRSTNVEVNYYGRFQSWSHEARVAYGQGGPLSAQAGLYYFREKTYTNYFLGQQFASLVAGPNGVGYRLSSDPFISLSKGAFGQVTYSPIDNLNLTGGIRYTKDEKSRGGGVFYDIRNPTTGVVTTQLASAYISSRNFDKITWKVGADYDVPGLGMIYANVSTGYKAGGFNDGCIRGEGTGCALTEASLYFNPETVTAYEAGFKFFLLDRRLRLNLSAYHYDYKDLQLSTFATTASGGPTRLIQNAGSAKVDGVEADAHFALWPNSSFDLSASYNNARYDDFVAGVSSGGRLYTRDFHGKLLDHAPKWSGTVGFEQKMPLADGGELFGRVATAFSSAYYIIDLGVLGQYRQAGYTKTDLTVGYSAPGDAWYIQAFGRNLENEVLIAHAGSGFIANTTLTEPRTYGLQFGFKY